MGSKLRKKGFLGILKPRELAHHLIGKKKTLEGVLPGYQTDRLDSEEKREKKFSSRIHDGREEGSQKGTLNYLKKNAESDNPFSLNKRLRKRLKQWDGRIIENYGSYSLIPEKNLSQISVVVMLIMRMMENSKKDKE